jgi:hypothetical protein
MMSAMLAATAVAFLVLYLLRRRSRLSAESEE